MSGGDIRPEDVASSGEESIAELLRERGGDDPDAVDDVPAGGAGADSGSSAAVRVDPDDESTVKDESIHNDEPGVGTRRSED